MTRKGHKKSRRGCAQCKIRHLKCDESTPSCRRCATVGRECSYVDVSRPFLPGSHASSRAAPQYASSTGLSPQEGQATLTFPLTPNSLLHLELFHNFQTQTCRTFAQFDEHIDIYRCVVIDRVFKAPYLMQVMLGLSALHLSLVKKADRSLYKHAATSLQSQALESFEDSQVVHNVTAENVLELLMFQHMIALHVFCDIFQTIGSDFGEFLERLGGCIHLLRGLNSVSTQWWKVLVQTEIGAVMRYADSRQQSPHESRCECSPLLAMLNRADLGQQSIEVCRETVDRLQGYFDAEDEQEEDLIVSTHMLFAWLVTASPEYTSLLVSRRPEALIILAYYAVLLYRRQRSWVVGAAGRDLLREIKKYLGSSWETDLEWPSMVILESPQAEHAAPS